jgi:hypothetical protein
MRVLIIAGGRTGGKRFSQWLSMETGYEWIHEPFFHPDNTNRKFNKDNTIVKLLVSEFFELTPENYIDSFDKIIGLSRNNTMDTAISQTYGELNNLWQENYKINETWIDENKSLIEFNEKMAIETNESLSKIENIELRITYEGLFYDKIIGHKYCKDVERIMEYINLDSIKYPQWIDNSFRYRNNDKKLNLI